MFRIVITAILLLGLSACVEYKDVSSPEWEEPVYIER